MKPYAHTRLRRGRVPARPLSAEEAAVLLGDARAWRDEWRAEVATRQGVSLDREPSQVRPALRFAPARNNAAQFAAAMARCEFGRFYWNGRLAAQLAGAMKDGPAGGRTRKSGPTG